MKSSTIELWAAHAMLGHAIETLIVMAAPKKLIEHEDLEEAFLDLVISEALVRMEITGPKLLTY